MKKNLLAVAVLTASAFTTSVFAADGKLNITGSITDQSCTVDPDSQNKQVALGKIAKDAFIQSNTAGAKAFNLVLKTARRLSPAPPCVLTALKFRASPGC